jgi:hypothetical protein
MLTVFVASISAAITRVHRFLCGSKVCVLGGTSPQYLHLFFAGSDSVLAQLRELINQDYNKDIGLFECASKYTFFDGQAVLSLQVWRQ